jgi:outer membrane receptor protein involved in Fe transport
LTTSTYALRTLPRAALALAVAAVVMAARPVLAAQKVVASQPIVGTAKDALGRPIAGVTIDLQSADGRTVARTSTDGQGRFELPAVKAGTYALVTERKGFKPATQVITTPEAAAVLVTLVLQAEQALTVPVSAGRLRAQNRLSETGASKYTFTAKDVADLPEGQATALNEVMLQMPGVALDQNQEIHVRGEHMGIQYQMNGILLPLDINNDPTFTQLLNSYFVKSVSLADGILPSQYGYRTAGVIDIETKDGCDSNAYSNFTIYGGMRDTAQPSFELAGCRDRFSYYLTGLYRHSNLGFSSATRGPTPIHDDTDQGQGFAYLTYTLNPQMKLSLISGMTIADTDFPNRPDLPPLYELAGANPADYPSSGIDSSLAQQDYYGVLALNGVAGSRLDYQLAYSIHYNSQTFHPDPIGDLIYQGVASHVLNSDLSNTLQEDTTYRLGAHTLGAGLYVGEYGVESDDRSRVFKVDAAGNQTSDVPITVDNNLNKINLVYGVYVQDTWELTDKLSMNVGSRWDRVSGFAVDSQFSPTINFVYKVRPDTTLHAGFARNFQIPNFQGISSRTAATFAGTSGAVGVQAGKPNAVPETDYYWDAGLTHELAPHLVFTNDNYFRLDRHYLDEGQFGFVPIDSPLNYVRGYGGGTENSLTYNLPDLTLRAGIFVAREEDRGVATAQFNFPADELAYIDKHYFVLDHTPLVGASGGAAYRWGDYQFTASTVFSSGLRGGFANQMKLPDVWQVDLSAARDFNVPGLGKVNDRIVLINAFDRINLIRPATGIGVFQSAYGPRIALYEVLSIPLPSL